MEEQVVVEEETQEEEVDGRTVVGKLQAKVQKLEDTQVEILKTLLEHGNKIAECSVRR
jgi:hypothetical protein